MRPRIASCRMWVVVAFLWSVVALCSGMASAWAGASPSLSIVSDRLEMNDKTQVAVFAGHVVADDSDGRMRLTADKMTVYYDKSKKGKGAAAGGGGVREVKAEGQVVILQEKNKGTADVVHYQLEKRTLELTGTGRDATVRRGEDLLTGRSILVTLDNDQRITKVSVQGAENHRVSARITPNGVVQRTEPKSEMRIEPKPEPRNEPKPTPRTEPKPESRLEPAPATTKEPVGKPLEPMRGLKELTVEPEEPVEGNHRESRDGVQAPSDGPERTVGVAPEGGSLALTEKVDRVVGAQRDPLSAASPVERGGVALKSSPADEGNRAPDALPDGGLLAGLQSGLPGASGGAPVMEAGITRWSAPVPKPRRRARQPSAPSSQW